MGALGVTISAPKASEASSESGGLQPLKPAQGADRFLDDIKRQEDGGGALDSKWVDLGTGLTTVKMSNQLRLRWDRLLSEPYDQGVCPALWLLLGGVRSRPVDELFVLTLPNLLSSDEKLQVCAFSHGHGKKWFEAVPIGSGVGSRELSIIGNAIRAILLLHGIGINLQTLPMTTSVADCITVDEHGQVKLLLWAALGGATSDAKLFRKDWQAMVQIIRQTWDGVLRKKEDPFVRVLGQAVRLLQDGSEKNALLAWTLLQP